ncbi:MAG TPA: homocysteine S-methyltransferase [Actinomycetota bacterium]
MTADPFARVRETHGTLVLDGGLATELVRRGADLRDPLWSAKVLVEDPDAIRRVHEAYFEAGADVAISASYQATFEGLAGRGIERTQAATLMRRSVELARDAASGDRFVAASVGPYGAMLGNGAEYTGDYDKDEDELVRFHVPRLEALAEAGPDAFAVETIPSFVEAGALARALERVPEIPAWVSFSCRDGGHVCDGTPIASAVEIVAPAPSVIAVGVNCTSPLHVERLVETISATTDKPVVCYPNRGSFWDRMRKTWTDPPRQDARPPLRPLAWREAGASLIGGCCGTTPEDIAAIAAALGRA